MAAVKH